MAVAKKTLDLIAKLRRTGERRRAIDMAIEAGAKPDEVPMLEGYAQILDRREIDAKRAETAAQAAAEEAKKAGEKAKKAKGAKA